MRIRTLCGAFALIAAVAFTGPSFGQGEAPQTTSDLLTDDSLDLNQLRRRLISLGDPYERPSAPPVVVVEPQ